MEEKDIKTVLTQEFQDDPIYKLALLNKLEDYLFTEGILSMHLESTYSTVETGKIIERSDSTIRNHFRSDLIDYIAPEKFGKYYRLNYKSVFRLQLIFILMEKASKTSVDLLHELGMQPAIQMGGYVKKLSRQESRGLQEYQNGQGNQDVEEYESRLETLERGFSLLERNLKIQGSMLNISEYQSSLRDIDSSIRTIEMGIEVKKAKAETKYEAHKRDLLLTNSLKRTTPKSSFFGLFKKQEEINFSDINNEIDPELKEKLKAEIDEEIKEDNLLIKELEQKKIKIQAELDKERERFKNLQIESSDKVNLMINNTN